VPSRTMNKNKSSKDKPMVTQKVFAPKQLSRDLKSLGYEAKETIQVEPGISGSDTVKRYCHTKSGKEVLLWHKHGDSSEDKFFKQVRFEEL